MTAGPFTITSLWAIGPPNSRGHSSVMFRSRLLNSSPRASVCRTPGARILTRSSRSTEDPGGITSRTLPSKVISPLNFSSSISRRSEEHTSELQSRQYLVCRLLLEKKNLIHLVQHIHLTL